jgi:hypothetical protein
VPLCPSVAHALPEFFQLGFGICVFFGHSS